MHKYMTVEMPDGSKWGVPVEMIAMSRAKYYAHEYEGDVERSLGEDTLPLFRSDDYEIQDWAVNNMDWSDFDGHQVKLADAPAPDFQEAWLNGAKGFADHTERVKSAIDEYYQDRASGEHAASAPSGPASR